MSALHIDLHLHSDDQFTVEADEHDVHQWVWLGDPKHAVFCDDATTADRVADAFRKLAIEMRCARHIAEEIIGEGQAAPVMIGKRHG